MGDRRIIRLVISSLFAVILMAGTAACGDADDPTVTASPSETPLPTGSPSPTPTIEPFRTLTLQASLTPPVITAGGTLTVRTDAGGSGLAQYTLSVDDYAVSVVRWDNVLVQDNSKETVQVVSWTSDGSHAEWVLRVREPGDHTVSLFVSGEVSASPAGPFYFTHGTQRFQFMVNQPALRR